MNLPDDDELSMFEDKVEQEIEENDRAIIEALQKAERDYYWQIYLDEHYNSPECNQ